MLYEVLAGRLDYLRYAPARAEASPTPKTKRRLKWIDKKIAKYEVLRYA
jgi:accessory gene regulator protein AgrB